MGWFILPRAAWGPGHLRHLRQSAGLPGDVPCRLADGTCTNQAEQKTEKLRLGLQTTSISKETPFFVVVKIGALATSSANDQLQNSTWTMHHTDHSCADLAVFASFLVDQKEAVEAMAA